MTEFPQIDEWARRLCVSRAEMRRQVDAAISDVYRRLTRTEGVVEVIALGESPPVARVRARQDSSEFADVPIAPQLWGAMYVAVLRRLNLIRRYLPSDHA